MDTRTFIEKRLRNETKRIYFGSIAWSDRLQTVYSYGSHYPLARIIDGIAFINTSGYSVSTGRHIRWAWDACANIVGRENVYGVNFIAPIKGIHGGIYGYRDLDLDSIIMSANVDLEEIEKVMATKKRHDTFVYRDLESKAYSARRVIEVANNLKSAKNSEVA